MKDNIKKLFVKYVSQNVLGMIGTSIYILADTFFISKAVGSDGITALNLVLPIYSLIFAIGCMIGVGSAIKYSIHKVKKDSDNSYFMNSIFWGTVIGILFMLVGIFAPDKVIRIMGGDDAIVEVGKNYTRIFMIFAPCFICNHICNAFVRNDGSPSIAMMATLISSLFNIIFDYVLMFPLKMKMSGAALATALSPLVGMAVCCIHFFSKNNNISFKLVKPSIKLLLNSCKLGISAFVGEISSGVITVSFNMLILGLEGNIGVAAYGVVANISLVAMSVFNGVAQGSQPLLSEYYGKNDKESVNKIRNMGITSAIVIAIVELFCIWMWTKNIVNIFNSEHDKKLELLAIEGLRLYFIGFLFAGVNIISSSFFSATEYVKKAFIISIMRGFVAIICCAVIMSNLMGMRGVWLAFPMAELITLVVSIILVKSKSEKV
jgi:putative MATE family efflux protein